MPIFVKASVRGGTVVKAYTRKSKGSVESRYQRLSDRYSSMTEKTHSKMVNSHRLLTPKQEFALGSRTEHYAGRSQKYFSRLVAMRRK